MNQEEVSTKKANMILGYINKGTHLRGGHCTIFNVLLETNLKFYSEF